MTQQTLGRSDFSTPRLAYGCMRIAGTWNPAEITPSRAEVARQALQAAYDAGYTLFDHADIYCRGGCEELHGQFLRNSPDLRKQTIIADKCGIRPQEGDTPGRYDFSKDWIIRSCEGSLKRLGVECIDIYQLHRPDVLMNPAEVAEAFDHLALRGMVKRFGVSNFYPSQLTLLQKSLNGPVVVNQVEISLKRLDCFVDGTLDQCLSEGITPLSWSPLGGGSLGERTVPAPDDLRQQALLEALDALASERGVTRTVIALAWLLKHPSKIIPIVGSTNPENIHAATKADEMELTREEWYRLFIAARGEKMP